MNIEAKIKKNISLAGFTTFRIGGPAKFFVEIETQDELVAIFEWIRKKDEKYIILAGGSNVLIADAGFDGLVIVIRNNKVEVKGDRIEADAGSKLSRSVTTAVSNTLAGLEWAVGIPGSLGGAIRGNAGAFGFSISDNVELVEYFDIEKKAIQTLSRRDCDFSYRSSIFKKNLNYIIWKCILRLSKGSALSVQSNINEYNNYRSKSQPKLPSAGCVFTNLIIKELDIDNNSILKHLGILEAVKGGKVGAGWLIDKAGLRGKRMGGAKVSLEHANFIVNTSNATADDVVMLISYIKQKIREKFKVQLVEEVVYLGF